MSNSNNYPKGKWPFCKALVILGFALIAFAARSQSVVTNVTSPNANGNYSVGASLTITVTFNEVVNVTGTPCLLVDSGILDYCWLYSSGSGTTTLSFTHIVVNGDLTADLSYVDTGSLSASSGTIQNALLIDANLTLPAIGAAGSLSFNKNIIISDTQKPVVFLVNSNTTDGTYTQCETISITIHFDEPVIVTGTPRLQLETGTVDQFATYSSGSGNSLGSLTFTYTVQSGDVSSDLDYLSTTALTLNGGSILDQSNNSATLTLPSLGGCCSLSVNKNLVIDGSTPVTPVTQASGISFSNLNTNSYTVSWTNGSGSRRLVVAKASSAVDANPVNGTAYTASTSFGAGTQLGTGNFVVFNGTGNSVTLNGLATNTVYFFSVFEYNGVCSPLQLYNTASSTNNPSSRTTLASQPTVGPSLTASSITDISLSLNWSNGNGTSRIIFAYDNGAPSTPVPVDGTSYNASSVFGSSDFVTPGGGVTAYVVYSGNSSPPLAITNLRPGTSYRFYMYEYNGSNGSENYSTTQKNITASTPNPTNPLFFAGSTTVSSINSTGLSPSFWYAFYNSSTTRTIASIQIKQGALNQVANWTDVIQSATISCPSCGGCASGSFSGTVSATGILFTSTGSCTSFWRPNTGDTEVLLGITLKTSMANGYPQTIDGTKLDFAIDNTSFILTSGTMDPSNVPVDNAVSVNVAATKLKFLQQPPVATWSGIAMTPAVTVEATDNNGNRDLDFVSSAGLTSNGTLSSAQSTTFASGIGSYSNVVHSATGTGLTLSTTNSSTLTNATSSSFLIAQPLQLSPDVMTLYPRASNPEKIVMTLTKAPNLTSGTTVTGFTTSIGAIASAVYSDNLGSAPFTVTLTSAANSQWTNGTTFNYLLGTGNLIDVYGFELNTFFSHPVVVETTPPSITSVAIPNVPMKVGDVVTATITVANDDGDDAILVAGGTIGGFTVGSLVNSSSTSKTVTFTVAEGGADVAAGNNIPVSIALKDGQNNIGTTYTAAIAQASDAIDANSPKVVSVNRQSATNGWSSSGGTSASSVVFRATFSENIDGTTISAPDFSIPVTGSVAGAILFQPVTAVTGTSVYDVTINSYTGTGTLGLNYVDNNDANAIKDLAGNFTITSIGNADGDFTGQTFSIVLPEPTNNVTSVSAKAVSASQAKISWTNASLGQLPTHLLIQASQSGTIVSTKIIDGNLVAPDEDFSDGVGFAIINLLNNPTQISYTFSGMISTTQYNFVIYPYTLSSNNSADNIDYKIGSNPTAIATLSALTFGSLNAGGNDIAASPLVVNSTSQAILGFSMVSNGTQTVSTLTVHTSSSSLGILSNFALVRSTDNIYSTTGDNTTIGGLTFTPSSNQIVITGLAETITSLKNYFLIANVSATVNGATTALQNSFSEVDATVNQGFVTTGTITGTNYSFLSSQQSDIVFSSGVSSIFPYVNFQAATGLTTSNSASLGSFVIRDGGSTADTDNQNTILSGVTLDFGNNYSYFRRVAIFDGLTNVAELDVAGEFVTFTGLSYLVSDGGNRTFTVRATFSNTVVDNGNIQVIVSGATATNAGSGFASFSPANSSVHTIAVVADRLYYAFPPSTILTNQNFGLTVRAADVNNNKDEDFTGAVALSKFSGSGTLSSTDAGGLSRSLSLGSVSWAQLQISLAGAYTIRASLGGLTSADLNVTALAAAAEPTVQTTALNFSTPLQTSVVVNMTNGNGASRVLVAKAGTAVDSDPVDGTSYSASNIFGSGAQIGTGNYVVGSGSGPITVTGLTVGTIYYFRAYEFNGSGGTENYYTSTDTGNPSSVTTIPPTPTAAAAALIGQTSFTANWAASAGASGYYLDVSSSNTFATLVSGYNNLSVGNITTYAVNTNLSGGTSYFYRVRASNSSGTSSSSNTISVTTTPPDPMTSAATSISQVSFTANWAASTGATYYSIDVSTSNTFATFVGNYNNFSVGNVTSYAVTGLSPGTTCYFQVSASNASGTSNSSNTISATTLLSPTITSFNPTSGSVGTLVIITGTDFDPTPANNLVKFNNTAAIVTASTSTSITASVPTGATSGTITVTISGSTGTSSSSFTVIPPPTISDFNPTSGVVGTAVTITGTNFDLTPANNTVKFNGTTATVTASTATSITSSVPLGATTGAITVTTNSQTAISSANFTVIQIPTISNFSPASGIVGAPITITGTNFDPTSANNTVKFNGTVATVSASTATTITTSVPTGATTGTITVTTNSQTATSSTDFTVISIPTISSFTPTSGVVGIAVTITGTNYDLTPANNIVKFNGTVATVSASTATTITTSVPSGATTGTIAVTVAGQTVTSSSNFTITTSSDSSPPSIADNTAPTVDIGSGISITATIVDSESTISSASVEYRSISAGGSTEPVNLSASGSIYSANIPFTQFGELGIEYKISASSSGGTSNTGTTFKTVRVKYPATSTGLSIPYTSNGSDVSNYRIVSVPLAMTANTVDNVFGDELGAYGDRSKWRMYRYDNGATTELGGSTTIDPGKGYWLISKASAAINSGVGTTVQASSATPFQINLKADWNEIGNPYNYNLSWADVQAANPGLPGLRIYNGDFADATVLRKLEGGFVKVTTAQSLIFPVVKNASVQGRLSSEAAQNRNTLDNSNWQVNLTIQQGELTNTISGFGMNEKASAGFDSYDGFNMPKFFDKYLVLNHNKKEGNDYYSSDIVPTSDNNVWEFSIESTSDEKLITLHWDNTYFGQNNKELYLWDANIQRAFDMRSVTSYQFDKSVSKNFRVIYGSIGFVKEKTAVSELVLHNLWPNPTSGDATLSFSLPESLSNQTVEFSSYDMMGRTIWTSRDNYNSGYHEVNLKRTNEETAGVYIIRLTSGSTVKQARLVVK